VPWVPTAVHPAASWVSVNKTNAWSHLTRQYLIVACVSLLLIQFRTPLSLFSFSAPFLFLFSLCQLQLTVSLYCVTSIQQSYFGLAVWLWSLLSVSCYSQNKTVV
jgi:hypothetical protein